MYSRTAALAALPVGCGTTAMCRTWSMARSDEKSPAGAVAGTGAGGRKEFRLKLAAAMVASSAMTAPRADGDSGILSR